MDPSISSQITNEKRRDFRIKEKDQKPFLAYLYLSTLNDFDNKILGKVYEKSPETTVFKEIFKYWKSLKLITELK
jgi:hypothetical protein